MTKLIEHETTMVNDGVSDAVERTRAIIEIDGQRVLLIEGDHAGRYYWAYGMAVQVLPTDTLESLSELPYINDFTSGWDAMVNGYDDERPVLNWADSHIARVAREAGL